MNGHVNGLGFDDDLTEGVSFRDLLESGPVYRPVHRPVYGHGNGLGNGPVNGHRNRLVNDQEIGVDLIRSPTK